MTELELEILVRVVEHLVGGLVALRVLVELVAVPSLGETRERIVDVHPHVACVDRIVEVVLALEAQQVVVGRPVGETRRDGQRAVGLIQARVCAQRWVVFHFDINAWMVLNGQTNKKMYKLLSWS